MPDAHASNRSRTAARALRGTACGGRRLMSAALVALVLFVAAPAGAQYGSLTPEEARRVEELVLQAKARRDKGRLVEAVAALEEAARLHPADWVLYNLARTYEDADSPEQAREQYERVLTLQPEDALRERAEEGLRRIRAVLAEGRLRLDVAPDGARVLVDGELRGVAPLAPLVLPTGTHLLRVEAPGYLPFEAEVDVPGAREVVRHVGLAAEAVPRPVEAASRATPWQWVALGTGAALVGTGALLYVLGDGDLEDVRSADGYGSGGVVDMSARTARSLEASGRAKEGAGIAMLVLGSAALATSATLFVLDGTLWTAPDAPAPPSVSLFGAPGAAGVSVRGGF